MRGFLILCDFAETINGKLYIQGGGWTRYAHTDQPITIYLASKLLVPWNEANRDHRLTIKLLDSDARPVPSSDGRPVTIEGGFEVGRPPGLASGSEIDLPLTFKFEGLSLTPGRYRWEMKVDDTVVADPTFDIVAS